VGPPNALQMYKVERRQSLVVQKAKKTNGWVKMSY
jgi:hypothetical protein